MKPQPLPLIVLGGSDRTASVMPRESDGQHPLSGYKGADTLLMGRSLVEVVLERARDCGCFAAVYLAGPERVYRHLVGSATLVDTDGSFGHNIRSALETACRRHPGSPVAFLTCDVVPEVETLQRLLALYADHAPCDLWAPMVRVRQEDRPLGASAWKPRYRIVPRPGEPPVEALPGHLVVVDPDAVSLDFAYQLFQIAYATRNRPIDQRRNVMLRRLVLGLLAEDLRSLLRLRPPTLAWTVIRAGVAAAGELRRGTITCARLEDSLRILFVKRRHRKLFPERRVVVPIIDDLSIAMDVDTEEEARELTARLNDGRRRPPA
jgi:hypothetical protein